MRISYKNLKRYKEIAHVLIKYGFSVIVEKLNIEEVAYKIPITNPSEEIKNMSTATKIRCVIEELGPTYIKFGQLLSTRKDLFDQDIIDELSKLRDSVEPFDTDIAKAIFKNETGLDIDDIFKEFNDIPIGSASIGQVYEGKLKNNEDVIVKIQRPNIEETIKSDIEILRSIASALKDLYKDKVENLAWDQDRISEAVITAENSDVVILCVGLNETLEGEEGDTGNSDASGDKVDLHLPKVQEELIEKVTAVGKPTIVVLMAGSAIDLNYAQDNCNGILLAWYPVARGGRAIADLLFGKESPSGKLPITFYKDLEGMPEFTDYSMKNRTYRYMEKEALYPFGYGLTYSDTCVTEAEVVGEVSAESDIMLKATVKNNGTVDTDEVVQVYIKDLDSPLAVRNYSLCGFKRVSLKAGEEKSVEFTISNKAMNIVDEDGNRYIAGKHFRLFAGVSQPDTRSAELTGHKPAEVEIAL